MLLEHKDLINDKNRVITLATSGPSGPNICVARAAGVISDRELLICRCEMVKTIANLTSDPRVCITCFDENMRGVRIYGTAEYLDGENKWTAKGREFLRDKNSIVKGIILVTAQKVEPQS